MKAFRIFVVEDETMYAEMISYYLSLNPDYEIEKFRTGSDCLKNLYKNPSAITLDYSLPDMDGSEVLKKIKELKPEVPVVIISGQEDIATAIQLLKEGAYDYLEKNDETRERLWNIINHIREKKTLKEELESLKQEVEQKYSFDKTIVGSSPAIKHTFDLIQKAARTNITVSVTGETGTGKELVAKAIHYNSARSRFPFVPINVAAIPKELIESEMFGYEKGAFTGANSRRIGKFEEADKGTLFLDEIGEMDPNMQSKLLRVLQEKELSRVGGNQIIKIDVAIVVATHKNLAEEVKKGNFREDLYYRLLGLPIPLPPLRERGHDIILLAKHFVQLFCIDNKIKPLNLTAGAQKKLLSYSWPGNVRELKAIIDLACVMSNSDQIEENDIIFNSLKPENTLFDNEMTMKDYEKYIIKKFLHTYDNNVVLVAKKLDIGKSTIYRMIQQGEI